MPPTETGAPIGLQRRSPFLPVSALLRRLVALAEVDWALIFGMLIPIRGLLLGPVTALLIAFFLSPEVQGYYYTFGSLLALQLFVELGFGRVIIQFASHEWAGLGLDERGRIVGSPDALSRLVSLGHVALRWYAIGGVAFIFSVGAAGYLFFSQSPDLGIEWMAPWLVLCVVTGIRLCLAPLWALLEGCNQVSQVYMYRFSEGVLGALAIWLAILLGAGLWAPAVSTLVGLAWGGTFLRRRYWEFFQPFFAPAMGPRVRWRAEIWPMQWRIAGSWASGYLAEELFTPVLFHYHGAVAAGQMGMTWSLVSALSAFSGAWATTKAPRFGVLIARKDYAALDQLFFRSSAAALLVACGGASAIWTGISLLNFFAQPLALRLLPPLSIGLFLLATILMQIPFLQASYLRAHRREPFLGLSVAGGLLIGSSTFLLGSRLGAVGMASGYLAIVAFFIIPYGTMIWYRCRAAWHAAGNGSL